MSTWKWVGVVSASVVMVGIGIWWLIYTSPTAAQLNQTVATAQEYQRLGGKPPEANQEPLQLDGRFFVGLLGLIFLVWVGAALIQGRVRRRPVVGSHTRPLPVINLATLPPKYTRKIGHRHR